jgi:hypothetical protein
VSIPEEMTAKPQYSKITNSNYEETGVCIRNFLEKKSNFTGGVRDWTKLSFDIDYSNNVDKKLYGVNLFRAIGDASRIFVIYRIQGIGSSNQVNVSMWSYPKIDYGPIVDTKPYWDGVVKNCL